MTVPLNQLSDDSLRLWLAYFMMPRNTLSFGGEGAKMAITPRARAALDELIEAGCVEIADPDCSTLGREMYRSGAADPRDVLRERSKPKDVPDNTKATDIFNWADAGRYDLFVRAEVIIPDPSP